MRRGALPAWFTKRLWFPFFFSLILLFRVYSLHAAELTLTSSAGYDSNPARYEDEEGSFFAAYGVSASHRLISTNRANLGIAASASYRDHFSLGDNYRLEAGPELSFPLFHGALIPAVSVGAVIYRDYLVDEDERNEVFADLGLAWFASRSAVITLRTGVRRLDYLNEASRYGGRADGGSHIGRGGMGRASFRNGKGPGGGQGQGTPGGSTGNTDGQPVVYPGREDNLITLGADLDLALSPSLSLGIYGSYSRLDSSRSEETRDIAELGASLEKRWEDLWAADFNASVRSSWFHESRRDKGAFISLRLSRFFGRWRLFAGADLSRNDSTAGGESYTQVMTECGVSCSY